MSLDKNTIWYDTVLNQLLKGNEHPKLATPFKEGTEAETETASTPTSKSTTEPL